MPHRPAVPISVHSGFALQICYKQDAEDSILQCTTVS